MKLNVYTDGSSRGNPGNAGIGVYIVNKNGEALEKRYKNLGEKTNNEAEYLGAYYGLKRAMELGASKIELFMDSRLVIKQLSGEWKIKKKELQILHANIQKIVYGFGGKIHYNWIEREKNKEADRLSKLATDAI